MVIVETLITAEQLLQMPAVEHCELIRGELIKMSPTGLEHGRVANRISVRLGVYVEEHQLSNTYWLKRYKTWPILLNASGPAKPVPRRSAVGPWAGTEANAYGAWPGK